MSREVTAITEKVEQETEDVDVTHGTEQVSETDNVVDHLEVDAIQGTMQVTEKIPKRSSKKPKGRRHPRQ